MQFRKTYLLTVILLVAATAYVKAVAPPNVIVILTDDQGWGDLSVNGNSNLATPNIDSLARDGMVSPHRRQRRQPWTGSPEPG